jgi:hypothetical protein
MIIKITITSSLGFVSLHKKKQLPAISPPIVANSLILSVIDASTLTSLSSFMIEECENVQYQLYTTHVARQDVYRKF